MSNDIRRKVTGKEGAGSERCVAGDGQRTGGHGAGGCGVASIRRVPNGGAWSGSAQCYANGSGIEAARVVDSGRGNNPKIIRPGIGGTGGWEVGVFPGSIRIASEALKRQLFRKDRCQLADW